MTNTPNLPARQAVAVRAGGQIAALVPQSIDEAFRLANGIAGAGIAPRGLTTAPQIMMVIMAGAEVGLPPVQALQSFYPVNNRLTIWGDAVPALLWANGFKLREWYEGELGEDEKGNATYPNGFVAKCEVTRPDGEVIPGEFSVADAKEAKLWTKDGPWQTARKRMLKMRARAFAARDGAPDVLRGLRIREEEEDIPSTPERAPVETSGLAARLTGGNAEGFSTEHVTREIPADVADAVIEGTVEQLEAKTVESDEDRAPDTTTGPAHDIDNDEWTVLENHDGPAPTGIVYLLAGDDIIKGRLQMWQDGEPVSTVSQEGAALLPQYTEHPTPPEPEPEAPNETETAPETPETLAEEGVEGGAETEETGGFLGEMRKADSWLQIKRLNAELGKTDVWAQADEDMRDDMRRAIWAEVLELKKRTTPTDPVDQCDDPSAFRLWIATMKGQGKEGADAIEGTLRVLQKQAGWGRLTEAQQARVIADAKAFAQRVAEGF